MKKIKFSELLKQNNVVIHTPNKTDSPCDRCPNKPDPDKMVVGDSPCQWCQYYPFKMTCDCK
jgi:hypothetical protein